MSESTTRESRIQNLLKQNLPRHVALIMDGNGRWAKQRSLSRVDGHRAGIDTVRRIVKIAGDLDLGYITLYTFSSENWNRPPGEVLGIMKLLSETIKKELPALHENNVRIRTIGDLSSLPVINRMAMEEAMSRTASNTGLNLVIALNYGGRDEIVRAVRSLARQVRDESLDPDGITPDMIARELDTADMPDPDLLIRTSGEFRLSNFLLWQLAYTELWITETLWPDFSDSDFLDALESYAGRERRFGKTSQQVTGMVDRIGGLFGRKTKKDT